MVKRASLFKSIFVFIMILILFEYLNISTIINHEPQEYYHETNFEVNVDDEERDGQFNSYATSSVVIPDPYYVKSNRTMRKSIDEVGRLLGGGFVTSYQIDEFDCSEMAAFIEWKLERYGFESDICISSDFSGTGYGHAWVAVDLPAGRYYVEPTVRNYGKEYSFMIIQPSEDRYYKYDNYDRVYFDIYELAKYERLKEFDWWNALDFGTQIA